MGGDDTDTTVSCGPCGAAVSTAAVGPARIATCPGCGAVLDLAPLDAGALPTVASPPAPAPVQPPRVPMPMDVHVREQEQRLVVELPRNPIAAVWAPVAGVATAAFAALMLTLPDLPVEAKAGAAAMALAGGYALAQGVVSRLRLVAQDGRLELVTRPLPWLDGGVLLDRVRSLAVQRYVYTVRDGDPLDGVPAIHAFAWELVARTQEGASVAVLRGFPDPFTPLWLQQRLGEHLGLAPEFEAGAPAPGEPAP